MVFFGQVVVGPPGCGKTTYCNGIEQFMTALGRKCAIINLDFANDHVPYKPAVDVRDLCTLETVMDEFKLGPNGGLVYCMEYLLEYVEWLEDRIQELDCNYIIFDFPGQVELYTHHSCVTDLLEKLTHRRGLDCRLCSVHLVDSYYCCDPAVFISAVLLVASSMLRLGLPHVNVLSKVDLLKHYDNLPFQLSFYTEMSDLTPIARYVGAPMARLGSVPTESEGLSHDNGHGDAQAEEVERAPTEAEQRYRKMSEGICDVLTDIGLVHFLPMNVEDAGTVGRVLGEIDRANGYSFAASEAQAIAKQQAEAIQGGSDRADVNHLFRMAADNLEPSFMRSLDIQERYMDEDGGVGAGVAGEGPGPINI